MLIQPNSKLLFIGDSITDCGREHPVGEGNGLGNGYVSLVNALIGSANPPGAVRVLNTGTGGNTVRDLAARWQRDVYDLQPDWLSIMIGINDVWRQVDSPLQVEQHVRVDEYAEILERLVQTTQPRLKGIVLMTPYFIEPNPTDKMRAMMDEYGRVVAMLSRRYQTIFVDTQAAFDSALKNSHSMSLAWDRVHPNLTGHMILARAFLASVGFKWQPGFPA